MRARDVGLQTGPPLMLRLGVVGLGRMGRFYAQTLARLGPPIELIAVADPDPAARAAAQHDLDGVAAFAEPLAPLDRDDVDAVVIATPTSTHASLVIAAAQAGKAVFCEKPLALSLEQTRATLAAVDAAGVVLQVGFMRRFDPAYRQAYEAIRGGQIGQPLTFKAIGRDPACPPLGYADPTHSGGLVLDMAIHDFDLARWLMASEVERVSAEGSLLAYPELAQVGDIDNAVINLRFTNGALGNVEVSRNARYGYDVRTEVLGTDGAVQVGSTPHSSRGTPAARLLLAPPTPAAATELPFFVQRFAVAYQAQLEHFVDCLVHHRVPDVGAADALHAFEIAHAATLSWQQRRPVDIAEVQAARL